MTVKELIEKLQSFPENKNVYMICSEDSPMTCREAITDIFTLDGSKDENTNGVYLVRE